MVMKHYVYYHIDPISSQVKYVGKGSGNRAYETKYRRNHRHLEWLSELEKNGMAVKIEIPFEFESETDAYKKEKDLIADFRSKGIDLFNILPGGDPMSGSNNPMYGRKRPDNIIRNKKNKGSTYEELYGKKRSDEIKSKLTRFGENNGSFGIKREDLARRNRSQAGKTYEELYGKEKADKVRSKLGGKPIIRSDGQIFQSIKSAAKYSNTSAYLLLKHLNGSKDSVNSYTFQYLDQTSSLSSNL